MKQSYIWLATFESTNQNSLIQTHKGRIIADGFAAAQAVAIQRKSMIAEDERAAVVVVGLVKEHKVYL